MESAPMISPPIRSARRRANSDLPLAVGPAISQMRGSLCARPMLLSLTLVAPHLDLLEEVLPNVLEAVAGAGYPVKDMQVLGVGAVDLLVEGDDPVILRARAEAALERHPVDVCAQLADGRRKALLIADMDSTIIGCECLDELADFAGLKDKISA